MITSIDAILRRLRGSHVVLLIALDDRGSLRRAAQQVSLSQPATTKSLREIESMFGVELFARSPRGVVANELGRRVTRYARTLPAEVGAVMGAVPGWLTPTLRALRKEEPNVSVEVWEDNSARLLSMLAQRTLDLVLGRPSVSVHPEAYDFILLEAEEMCIVVDGSHELARKPHVSLQDIAANPWIVPQAYLPLRSLLEQVSRTRACRSPLTQPKLRPLSRRWRCYVQAMARSA